MRLFEKQTWSSETQLGNCRNFVDVMNYLSVISWNQQRCCYTYSIKIKGVLLLPFQYKILVELLDTAGETYKGLLET